MCLGALQTLHILSCHRSDTTHTLHDVEHQALCLKQRASLALHDHGDVTLLHRSTILNKYLYLHRRVEASEHLLCHFNTSQNTIFLDEQVTLTHGIFRNTTQGCMVAITDILSKSQVYQLIF